MGNERAATMFTVEGRRWRANWGEAEAEAGHKRGPKQELKGTPRLKIDSCYHQAAYHKENISKIRFAIWIVFGV